MTRARSPGVVLTTAVAAQCTVSFINFGLPAISPELRREFGLSLPELGAVLTASLLGSGIALFFAGILVDRMGARRATFLGTTLAVAGLAAAALSHEKWVLFVSLVVSGIGSSVVPIAGAGAIFKVYPAHRRGWAMGVRQMAVPLGGMMATLLLPVLDRAWGASAAFAFTAAAVAVTGAAFAIIPEEGASAGGHRPERPLRRIWDAPGMPQLLLLAVLYIAVLQGTVSYFVESLRASGISAGWAQASFFVLNVTAMVARIAWGVVADRHGGSRRVHTLRDIGVVAAVGGLIFTFALHAGLAAALPASILFGAGALGWNAILYASAGERAGLELANRSVATAATVVFLFSGILSPVLGALAHGAGWDAFWATLTVLAAAGALVAARLPRVNAVA